MLRTARLLPACNLSPASQRGRGVTRAGSMLSGCNFRRQEHRATGRPTAGLTYHAKRPAHAMKDLYFIQPSNARHKPRAGRVEDKRLAGGASA